MKDQLKSMATKSKTALVAYKIYHNWQFKRRFASDDTESLHGSTHSHLPLSDSLGYIEAQFDDYMEYGELTPESVRGKRVFELGFGDNIGVALKFLASGAGHDAGILASAGVASGMLFVRGLNGGVSHSPDEDCATEDVALAADVLAAAVGRLASAP